MFVIFSCHLLISCIMITRLVCSGQNEAAPRAFDIFRWGKTEWGKTLLLSLFQFTILMEKWKTLHILWNWATYSCVIVCGLSWVFFFCLFLCASSVDCCLSSHLRGVLVSLSFSNSHSVFSMITIVVSSYLCFRLRLSYRDRTRPRRQKPPLGSGRDVRASYYPHYGTPPEPW